MQSPARPHKRLAKLTQEQFRPQPPMYVEGVIEEWVERFPRDSRFLRSICQDLDRARVKRICSNRSNSSARQKFLAVMLWGYGSYAIGATRAQKVTQEVDFDVKLRKVIELAQRGRHVDAISFMTMNPIKGFGPAYGTKLVYFCSPRNVCAPIYDKRVRDWLAKYARRELPGARLEKVQWHTNSYVAWSNWLQSQESLLGYKWEDLEYLIFQDAKKIRSKKNRASTRK